MYPVVASNTPWLCGLINERELAAVTHSAPSGWIDARTGSVLLLKVFQSDQVRSAAHNACESRLLLSYTLM